MVLREDVKLKLNLLPRDRLDEEFAIVRLEELGATLAGGVVVRRGGRNKGILWRNKSRIDMSLNGNNLHTVYCNVKQVYAGFKMG